MGRRWMVGIVLGALLAGCRQKATAERQAGDYIRRMHPNQEFTVTCMNYDNDHNGYVSCDAIVEGAPIALECAANAACVAFCDEGCKLRPMLPSVASAGAQ